MVGRFKKSIENRGFYVDRERLLKIIENELAPQISLPRKFNKKVLPNAKIVSVLNILLRYPNLTTRKWFKKCCEENITKSKKHFWKIVTYLRKNQLIDSIKEKNRLLNKVSVKSKILHFAIIEANRREKELTKYLRNLSKDIKNKKIPLRTIKQKINIFLEMLYENNISIMYMYSRMKMAKEIKEPILMYWLQKVFNVHSMWWHFMVKHNIGLPYGKLSIDRPVFYPRR